MGNKENKKMFFDEVDGDEDGGGTAATPTGDEEETM
jgi:hypothetical protein